MDQDGLVSIGELARRTGLTVKKIRFYSDRGIVSPAGRTPAGYRRYDPEAVAHLALVRTLRELGIGLDDIRRVVDEELTLGEVAAEHAAALDAQINILRLRRAILTNAARRNHTLEEMELMHQMASLSETERQRLIDDFLDAVFDDPRRYPSRAGVRRSMTPALPDDPTAEQLAAWVELAELAQDTGFRAHLRCLAEEHLTGDVDGHTNSPRPDIVAITRAVVGAAVASGIAPDSSQADRVVAKLTEQCALNFDHSDDTELHQWLLHRLEAASDTRQDRYVQLLAQVNGWPTPEPLAPILDWSVTALRCRTTP